MPHTIDKREVGRYYDLDTGEHVIVIESTHAHWNQPDQDKRFTRRTEKRVRLTVGEVEYLRERQTKRQATP